MADRGRQGFLGLSGNAAVCIGLFPLWSIPFTFYFFYLSLYMRASGVTDAQLGMLVFISSATSVAASFFSAPLVNRLGRRRSSFYFDLISSVLPCVLYAAGGSFPIAVIAMILANLNKIQGVGYYLLMTEDADNDQKVKVFNLSNIILLAAGLLIPLSSGIVRRYGVVRVERAFLVASAVLMTVLAFLRYFLTRETAAGMALMAQNRGRPADLRSLVKPYRDSFEYLRTHPMALAAAAADILFYVYFIIGTNNSLYFTPFFGDALGIGAESASILGAVYSAGTLLAMFIINPLCRKRGVEKNAVTGAIISAAGAALFVFMPRGSAIALPVAAAAVSAIGFGVLKPAVDAAIVVKTEGGIRAAVYATVYAISSILGTGAGIVCSAIYGRNPRSIYIISLVILIIIPLCFAAASAAGKHSASSRTQG